MQYDPDLQTNIKYFCELVANIGIFLETLELQRSVQIQQTNKKAYSPIIGLQNSQQETQAKEQNTQEEQLEQIGYILSDLKTNGKLRGKQSLAFAYRVKQLKISNQNKQEQNAQQKKQVQKQKTQKLKQFFKNRVKNKKKYCIQIPNFGQANGQYL